MLPAATMISDNMAAPTEAPKTAANELIQYPISHPNQKLICYASDMQASCYSDSSFLNCPYSQKRMGGVAELTNFEDPTSILAFFPPLCKKTPNLVTTVVEAEYATLFANGQQMYWVRTILESLGYPQKSPTLYCDNSVAKGIAMYELTFKRSKVIDVRYHWLRERCRDETFLVKK